VLGVYALGSSLCRKPFVAACASLASPAFLVSSTTVMCDVMMLACWVWALALWIEGVDAGDRRRLLASAALATACVLTKYNGAFVVPLLAVYAVWRKRPGALAHLALPAVLFAGYVTFMLQLYGATSLWTAVSLAAGDRAGVTTTAVLSQSAVTLAFAGGCFVSILPFALTAWPRWSVACGAAIIAAAWLWTPPIPGLAAADPARAIQFLLCAAGGAALVGLAVADARRKLDAASSLLLLWLAGTLAFSGLLSWSVGARYLLPLAPVSGILLARTADARRLAGTRVWAPVAAALAVALLVARADAALAASARTAAETILRAHDSRPGTVWYQGHWGFQYYMDLGGAKAVDFDHPVLATGDVMIIPANNANTQAVDPRFVAASDDLEFPVVPWLATISPAAGAGFYSSVFGPLPFVFGAATPERYTRVTIGSR
jgi:4-amino-4-deoxy-L-arabinose transferase-like glycosyltransferase